MTGHWQRIGSALTAVPVHDRPCSIWQAGRVANIAQATTQKQKNQLTILPP